MKKRALLVGINDYSWSPLKSAVKDVERMNKVLSENHDESKNFNCTLFTSNKNKVTRNKLTSELRNLFENPGDVALFYFSGHSDLSDLGYYLVTQDAVKNTPGISSEEILAMANKSKSKHIIIILECGYSNAFGSLQSIDRKYSLLRDGIIILGASEVHQTSKAKAQESVFTKLVIEALEGNESNGNGNITALDIYKYAYSKLEDQWNQTPIFKGQFSEIVTLRTNKRIKDKNIEFQGLLSDDNTTEKFNKEELNDISIRIDNVLNSLNKLGYGQEVIFDEINEM